MRDEADSSLKAKDLVGKVGRVTVRCRPDAPGKVLVEFEDSVREFLAISGDGELAVGTTVLVVTVENGGMVCVTPHDWS